MAELCLMSLDRRALYVLTFVDGISSLEQIVDACGLPSAECKSLFDSLLDVGATRMVPPAR